MAPVPRKKKLSRRLLEAIAIVLGALVLRVLFRTWRVEVRDAAGDLVDRPEKVVYAFWHNRMLGFVHTHRRRGVTVMVSRHGDGEIIARIIEQFGFRTVRGSTTRGGVSALKALIDETARFDVAITPDGPRGPRYRLKPGVVLVASKSGRKVVYGSCAASRAWRFQSWDRFIVPKPFARLVVRIEGPVEIPPELDEAATEAARRDLEARLNRLTAELDREVTGEADPALEEAAAAPERPVGEPT